MGASAVWSSLLCALLLPVSSISMSDEDPGIITEGDWLPEPVCEVIGGGKERSPMADLLLTLLTCMERPGDGRFIWVGSGRINPTRRLASSSR